jgi:GH15 family glucan-1,4-alpha-glucosidase
MSEEAAPPDVSGVRPIEDHALLGDTRTAALVASDGTIVWLCAPRFDSPPVFGSILASAEGGRFAISPLDRRRTARRYREGSAVLETVWETSTGRARLTDGMAGDVTQALLPQLLLVRRVDCLDGHVELEVLFDPRRDLGTPPTRSGRRAGALVVEWGSLALFLRTAPDLELVPSRPRRLRLAAGDSFICVLAGADRAPGVLARPEVAWSQLETTDRWWREWCDDIQYDGPSRGTVERSLLTLRLLTYAPSGAPVAAPTTSLPEEFGGERNWDYRLSWPRDASLGTAAFVGVGKHREAEIFLRWLTIASRLSRPAVQVLYDLDGRPGVSEQERWDVAGYAGSLPVRIGNAACSQHQLDVYGWIVEAAWQLERGGGVLDPDIWAAVRGWADFVCQRWREPDAGIWERRGEPQHFVHSKLMGWQALDRAIALAKRRRVRGSTLARWTAQRAALAAEIFSRGVDATRGTYVQRYGSSELDAALLMLPAIGIDPPHAPRVLRTVKAISSELGAADGLLYRYLADELGSGEGAFIACSFWLVQALSRLGRVEKAVELFESVCGRSNDVGLFAEEIDPRTGVHLGNFPQALTHSSLVEAALSIARATRGRARRRV